MSAGSTFDALGSAGLLEIGRVTRPHGVRGEVKVQLHWTGSEALFDAPEVLVRPDGAAERWAAVLSARRANRFVLLKLAGVESVDQATELRGARVFVARAALPPLQPGEYYLVDLVGARVECRGEPIGVVIAVRSYATVDVLVVETPGAQRLEQPIGDHWIEKVDIERRLIVLASTDGLIE